MSTLELRDQIAQYIEREISLQDLENWIVPRLPLLILDPSSTDADLVAAVELCLAEYSEGIRDEEGVRNYLRRTLQEHNVIFLQWSQPESRIITSTSVPTVTNRFFESVPKRKPNLEIIHAGR